MEAGERGGEASIFFCGFLVINSSRFVKNIFAVIENKNIFCEIKNI